MGQKIRRFLVRLFLPKGMVPVESIHTLIGQWEGEAEECQRLHLEAFDERKKYKASFLNGCAYERGEAITDLRDLVVREARR